MRYIALSLFFWCALFTTVFAQTDTVQLARPDSIIKKRFYQPPSAAGNLLDSVANALKYRQKFIGDSLSKIYIIRPDSLRTKNPCISWLRFFKAARSG
jgi:hypothetical protein